MTRHEIRQQERRVEQDDHPHAAAPEPLVFAAPHGALRLARPAV